MYYIVLMLHNLAAEGTVDGDQGLESRLYADLAELGFQRQTHLFAIYCGRKFPEQLRLMHKLATAHGKLAKLRGNTGAKVASQSAFRRPLSSR